MASNRHVDLGKIENFVSSENYPENILKDTGKKANFRKSCSNFKTVDGNPTYKGKRRVKFDKRLISQYYSIFSNPILIYDL